MENNEYISPYYLFYLLNLSIVQEQIKKKIFTQATLSTLGNRLEEVLLPIHKDTRTKISNKIKKIFDTKVKNKKEMSSIYEKYDV